MVGVTEEPDQAGPNEGSPVPYNRVLEYYTQDAADIDLVGLIAYALYKRQKRDWLVQYRNEHEGRSPSRSEIAAVTSSYLTEDLKQTLRDRASDLLTSYAETYVEAVEPAIKIEALNTEQLRQAREIETALKNKSSFWSQFWTGIVATGAWTLVVTALVLTASLFGSDIIDALNTLRAPASP